jgi:hypothetical protein
MPGSLGSVQQAPYPHERVSDAEKHAQAAVATRSGVSGGRSWPASSTFCCMHTCASQSRAQHHLLCAYPCCSRAPLPLHTAPTAPGHRIQLVHTALPSLPPPPCPQAKQALRIGESRTFSPTSIEHHWSMMGELGDFAHDLRQYEKGVRRWEAAMHGGWLGLLGDVGVCVCWGWGGGGGD